MSYGAFLFTAVKYAVKYLSRRPQFHQPILQHAEAVEAADWRLSLYSSLALPLVYVANNAECSSVRNTARPCEMTAQVYHGKASRSVSSRRNHRNPSNQFNEQLALFGFELTKSDIVIDVTVNELIKRIHPNADAVSWEVVGAVNVSLVTV